jgi:hypothetical protein
VQTSHATSLDTEGLAFAPVEGLPLRSAVADALD